MRNTKNIGGYFGGKIMTKYSRQQEDRCEKKLKKIGFKLLEDVGRRSNQKGDKIMEHESTGVILVVDHKSTRGEKSIRIEKAQLEKIKGEAKGVGTPVITFSFLNTRKIYAIFDIDDLEGIMY